VVARPGDRAATRTTAWEVEGVARAAAGPWPWVRVAAATSRYRPTPNGGSIRGRFAAATFWPMSVSPGQPVGGPPMPRLAFLPISLFLLSSPVLAADWAGPLYGEGRRRGRA